MVKRLSFKTLLSIAALRPSHRLLPAPSQCKGLLKRITAVECIAKALCQMNDMLENSNLGQ